MFVNEKLKQFKVDLNKRFAKDKEVRDKSELEKKIELEHNFNAVLIEGKKGKFVKGDGNQSKFDDYFVNHNKKFLAKYDERIGKERLQNTGSRSLKSL